MSLTQNQKREIASQARTLSERLASEPAGEHARENDEDWISMWQEAVADDDFGALLDRVDITGLSIEQCRHRLSADDFSGDSLPAWISTLEAISDYVVHEAPDDPPLDPLGSDTVPFAHLLSTVVDFASGRVEWAEYDLDSSARAALERWLLSQLRVLTHHVLFIEFKTYVAAHDEELALSENPPVPDDTRRYYDEFTRNLLTGGLADLFTEYSVLAKFLVVIVDNWIEAVEEFLARYDADHDRIMAELFDGVSQGRLTDVGVHGDPHQGGRRVFELTFESGEKVAYKPRGLDADVAFQSLLSWVNDRSGLPALTAATAVPGDDYGWMEWIDHEPCSTREAVARYYERAGMLLGLLYALGFTDGHVENIIAGGEHPIVVDLETVLQPTLPEEVRTRENEVFVLTRESVLRTGFLPMHLPDADVSEVGGIGGGDGKQTGVEIPDYTNVNTDLMDMRYLDTYQIEGESLPRLDGDQIDPKEHYDDIVTGFEQLYRFVLDEREALVAPDGPLSHFSNVELRFLFRSTALYGKVKVPFTTPPYLRSGRMLGFRIEHLASGFATGTLHEELWPVYEAERRALWQFDVPRFTVKADETAIYHCGEPLCDPFDVSPLSAVRQHILGLDDDDLHEQLDYISLAYASNRLGYPSGRQLDAEEADVTLDDDLAAQTARDIFGRLHENASRTQDGSLTWYIREVRANGAYLHEVLQNMYGGRTGVTLFAAGLANTFPERMYTDFTVSLADAIDDFMQDPEWAEGKRLGRAGVGSLVYTFTKLSELLDDERYEASARTAMDAITVDRIQEDDVLDVLTGCAGIILALVSLHEATGDDEALSKAVLAGERLLSTGYETDHGTAWNTIMPNRPSVGMSHGVGGIGYALFRLGEATGEDRFTDTAYRAIAHERAAFQPPREEWTSATESDFMPGWCAGLAGFGLTSLSMYEATGDEQFRGDVDRAIAGIDPTRLPERDQICGGTFGQVAFLQYAGRRLDEPAYVHSARELAGRAVERADGGRFIVPWQTERWLNPSYFVGESGIGYTLLQMNTEALPNILLWE